jgi:hypothetical protein
MSDYYKGRKKHVADSMSSSVCGVGLHEVKVELRTLKLHAQREPKAVTTAAVAIVDGILYITPPLLSMCGETLSAF